MNAIFQFFAVFEGCQPCRPNRATWTSLVSSKIPDFRLFSKTLSLSVPFFLLDCACGRLLSVIYRAMLMPARWMVL